MGAYPEPGDSIAFKKPDHAVVIASAGRINGGVALAYLLKLQARMTRVLLKEFVGCLYLVLGVVRQRIKEGLKSLRAS